MKPAPVVIKEIRCAYCQEATHPTVIYNGRVYEECPAMPSSLGAPEWWVFRPLKERQ